MVFLSMHIIADTYSYFYHKVVTLGGNVRLLNMQQCRGELE